MAFVDGSKVDGRTVVILRVPPPRSPAPDASSASPAAQRPVPADGAAQTPGSGAAAAPRANAKVEFAEAPAPAAESPKAPVLPAPLPAFVDRLRLSAASMADAVEKQAASFISAAKDGAPFCALCDQVKKLRELELRGRV